MKINFHANELLLWSFACFGLFHQVIVVLITANSGAILRAASRLVYLDPSPLPSLFPGPVNGLDTNACND